MGLEVLDLLLFGQCIFQRIRFPSLFSLGHNFVVWITNGKCRWMTSLVLIMQRLARFPRLFSTKTDIPAVQTAVPAKLFEADIISGTYLRGRLC